MLRAYSIFSFKLRNINDFRLSKLQYIRVIPKVAHRMKGYEWFTFCMK